MTELIAPFPWFGGKCKIAPEVWSALGNVQHYVEPFAGSLAVLLGRPITQYASNTETVNDLDRYLVNFWRALQHDPAAVAHHANNPVNESDLIARHIWLVNSGAERVARLDGDPEYYDTQVAGWWVWGLCCWIGSGWCSGNGPWGAVDGKLAKIDRSDGEPGVNRQLVHLGSAGQGVNRQSLHTDSGANGVRTGEAEILAYLGTLAERLRYVRVCCGDWQRVVTDGALAHGSTVGIFLDPPYDTSMREAKIYNHEGDLDGEQLSAQVRRWCIQNQDNPRYRIVLAGYEGEHDLPGWTVVEWMAGPSQQTAASAQRNRDGNGSGNSLNRKLERLWLSPNCLRGTLKANQNVLFTEDV